MQTDKHAYRWTELVAGFMYPCGLAIIIIHITMKYQTYSETVAEQHSKIKNSVTYEEEYNENPVTVIYLNVYFIFPIDVVCRYRCSDEHTVLCYKVKSYA